MGRKNDLDICADMLGVAQNGARKTHIVYQTNLNFNILKKYLDRLHCDDARAGGSERQPSYAYMLF